MIRAVSVFFSLMLMASSLIGSDARAQDRYVLYNARVYTVNPVAPVAEAMAVQNGRISGIGTSKEMLAAFPDFHRIDAGGKTVIPGLIDAHVHLMNLGLSMLQVDLVDTRSVDEVLDRLAQFEQQLPPGAWLIGRGWDQNDWPDQRFPTRHDLDARFPDRPVWLSRIDGHAAWANTAALRAAGEDRLHELADPEGGKIVRNAQGEPTGLFIDAAMDLVDAVVPPPTEAQWVQALELALNETRRYGLTGVHEAGTDLETIERFKRAIDEDRFDIRLYAMIGGRGPAFDHFCRQGPLIGYGDRLTVRSVKFFIDGALGSRGAALLNDYADDPGNYGLLMMSPDMFTENVRASFDCGFQVNTHAIGDRGNRVVLDTYESVLWSDPDADRRFRIEHAQIMDLDDIPRFSRLGIIASMQPTHATSDMPWVESRVGAARIAGAYAWRRFLEQGVHLAFGSDFPIEHVNPLLGFYAAVTRQDSAGQPPEGWIPDQRLTREEALRAFTLEAAYAAFQEKEMGSLEKGKFADFVVLSDDIMTIPARDILHTTVVATYLGGKPIFGSLE